MSEEIDGVVSSVSGNTKQAVVIVISGRLSPKEAEQLRVELKALIGKYKQLKIQVKPK